MLKRTSGILLPKDHEEFERIEHDLKRTILDFNRDAKEFKFYINYRDNMIIPRYYPVMDTVIDKNSDGEDIEIETNVKPRNERQELYIRSFLENDSGIIKAEPGTGKTVMSCAAIGKIKKKTIVFAHKKSLIEQWKENLIEFTSLKEEDIAILSSKKYEELLKKPVILSTPQVIAYAYKSKNVDFLNCLLNSNFGLMIIDECHMGVGPEKFSLASIHIKAKKNFGLSATPKRADNNDIIHYHLGKIINYKAEESELVKPKIYQIHFPFGVFEGKRKKYINWMGRFNMSKYYQQTIHGKKLMNLTSNWILDAYNKGRIVLVLGNQIKPLLELCKQCGIPKKDVGLFIPGIKDKKKYPKKYIDELTDNDDLYVAFNEKRVIYSTYQAARDGNNRVDLDCIIMLCPTSNIEQAIGRALRKKKGKKTPIILDLVDVQGPMLNDYTDPDSKVPFFIRSSQKRLEEYKRLGWEVEIKKMYNN